MAKKKPVPMEGEPVDPETGMALDAPNTGDGGGKDPSSSSFEGEDSPQDEFTGEGEQQAPVDDIKTQDHVAHVSRENPADSLEARAGDEDHGAHVYLENPGFAEPTRVPCPVGVPPQGARVILVGASRYEHVADHADGSWIYRGMA